MNTSLKSKLRLFFALLCFSLLSAASAYAQSAYGTNRNRLGVAIPYPIWKLDPLAINEPLSRAVFSNIGYSLVRIGKGAQTELEIASGMNTSNKGATWSFSLRPGVYFPSGAECSALRIRDSIIYLRDKAQAKLELLNSQLTSQRAMLASTEQAAYGPEPLNTRAFLEAVTNIDKVEVVNANSNFSAPSLLKNLRISLHKADPQFDRVLAELPIINVSLTNLFKQDAGVGSHLSAMGPYMIRENRPEKGLVLEGSNGFYRPSVPISSTVDFHLYANSKSALSALRVGAIDIIALPTQSQIAQAAQDPTLRVLTSPFSRPAYPGVAWKLKKTHWSENSNPEDKLSTAKIIVRKTLNIGDGLLERFDLSKSFLP